MKKHNPKAETKTFSSIPSEGSEDTLLEALNTEGDLPTPINISFGTTHVLELPDLVWKDFDALPIRLKLVNNGYTALIQARWFNQRPTLCGGVLHGNYLFNQLHFHWGSDDSLGSEHTVDGLSYPLELHMVLYKSEHLTKEEALKHSNGIITVVYFYSIQEGHNTKLDGLMDSLEKVIHPDTSTELPLSSIKKLVREFNHDYFMYFGKTTGEGCDIPTTNIICRIPLGISSYQLETFRKLLSVRKSPLRDNFRKIENLDQRTIFHVSPKETSFSQTLLPMPEPSTSSKVSNTMSKTSSRSSRSRKYAKM